jgi:hypothetical protein
MSDNPVHHAAIESVLEGMRKAAVPDMTAAHHAVLAATLAIDVVAIPA